MKHKLLKFLDDLFYVVISVILVVGMFLLNPIAFIICGLFIAIVNIVNR